MEELESSRLAAIHVLVFQFGGVAGAIRRIVHGWPGRFSRTQISIALQRRWPLFVPNEYQVEDCLDFMEKQRLIECVVHKHTKIYERRKYEAQKNHPRARPDPDRVVRTDLLPLFAGARGGLVCGAV
jgi:hypothetical protein